MSNMITNQRVTATAEPRQATTAQLDSLNWLRERKGYEPIHAGDWRGVTWCRAESMIEDMRSRAAAQ